jgi:hypothetical protein
VGRFLTEIPMITPITEDKPKKPHHTTLLKAPTIRKLAATQQSTLSKIQSGEAGEIVKIRILEKEG